MHTGTRPETGSREGTLHTMSAIQSDRRGQDVEELDAFPTPPAGRRGVSIQGRYIPYVLILPAAVAPSACSVTRWCG